MSRAAGIPDHAALVQAAVQLHHDLAAAVVVDQLELADVAWSNPHPHHSGERPCSPGNYGYAEDPPVPSLTAHIHPAAQGS